MNTRKIGVGVLIGGILWFAFMLRMPDFVTVPGFGSFQPDSSRQNWMNTILRILYNLPSAALGYLMLLSAISLPVGICSRLTRRRAAFRRLLTPAPHGKYLPWGRNLRRHASIPARNGSLRPRKTLRPSRQRSDAPQPHPLPLDRPPRSWRYNRP